MKYETGSKLEKHQAYLAALKEKIEILEKQKLEIDKELLELREKLSINQDYIPTEE